MAIPPPSTSSILSALHQAYSSSSATPLDPSTSLVVNSCLVSNNPTVDPVLARRAWEHARRRAEDGCIVLCSSHISSPPLLSSFLASAIPLSTPPVAFSALNALRPFVHHVHPSSPSRPLYSALSASYTFTLSAAVTELKLSLSTTGLDTAAGLTRIPPEQGYRAFDVFYYLLASVNSPSSSTAEREFLRLDAPHAYSLLNKSGTYSPPSYLPTTDDAAAGEDFRAALRDIGIKGSTQRSLIAALAAILKLGNTTGFLVDQEDLEEIIDDAAGLLNVDPELLLSKFSTDERETLIIGIYEAIVDWVLGKANAAIAAELQSINNGTLFNEADTVGLTVIDIPDPALGKAVALKGVFDDTHGINEEMKEDGIDSIPPPTSVLRDLQQAVAAVEPHLNPEPTATPEHENLETTIEKLAVELDEQSSPFLHDVFYPNTPTAGLSVARFNRFNLAHTLLSSRVWYHLNIHPADFDPAAISTNPAIATNWSAGAVSRQIRLWRLQEWATRRTRHLEFTADFDVEEFVTRYRSLGCMDGRDGIENWIMQRGWNNGEVFIGHERIWMREGAWWEAESELDMFGASGGHEPMPDAADPFSNPMDGVGGVGVGVGAAGLDHAASGYFDNPSPDDGTGHYQHYQQQLPPPPPPAPETMSLLGGGESRDNLLAPPPHTGRSGTPSIAPSHQPFVHPVGDYGLGLKGDEKRYDAEIAQMLGELDPEFGKPTSIEKKDVPRSRRMWVAFIWALTFWIPSPLLRYIGGMKRPDVRFAWREKLVLCFLIIIANCSIIFIIVGLDKILCADKNKAFSIDQVGQHTTDNDFWVAIQGKVYDISDWWQVDHSDVSQAEVTSQGMKLLAGQDLTQYFPPPLSLACPGLVPESDEGTITMQQNTTRTPDPNPRATHKSWKETNYRTSKLANKNWYSKTYQPKIKEFYKGDVVITRKDVKKDAEQNNGNQYIYQDKVYDLTPYFYTKSLMDGNSMYEFIPDDVSDVLKENAGKDITKKWGDSTNFTNTLNCMNNYFYAGKVDFRNSPRCTVVNYILLAFAIIICIVIGSKFIAALQLGSKRRPVLQDKFVICQVPAYTEGEDQIRKGLDSLTALQYDNKRKLICVICDGMIVGGGNDRPTPKIVLDILGVDPKIDPPALPFRSIGVGSEQLNYGKVYSGLYEFEGNVVPYIVVVKMGKPSEQSKSKPGNRGKRDSQMLLLNFLNKVHFRSPMSPLELELFHQINNIIGVDPELYEYLLMVDADTSVKEDSLNRLVAACANDAKIIGICGETSLDNEQQSWWTMIQVYEYYISHHLAKAFESLFGSVTCLPGCFCMYRLRTPDKGKPLIISDQVCTEYADCEVDTLHKKNLLSLGEDRFLTTLMLKHFPKSRFKFVAGAMAQTAAPNEWGILLSQRRRWINSTIHNLAELIWIKDLCGFCCFSMRFVVFIDLTGTLLMPATVVYLIYLIIATKTGSQAIPYISIAMIAGVYGLQAIIFMLHRQWQHIGWMIIYLLAYPVYSFILPLYSFWNQDNFSWGNTRVVIGEKGDKKVIAMEDDEGFDPRSIPLQRWDDYALANNLPGRRGDPEEKYYQPYTDGQMPQHYEDNGGNGVELEDMRSVYSSVRPASTILNGFPHNRGPFATPPAGGPYGGPGQSQARLSGMPQNASQSRLSLPASQYLDAGNAHRGSRVASSVLGGPSRPASTVNGMRYSTVGMPRGGPDDGAIIEAIQSCLADVDLDTVTKKQVRALVEQRLQTTLVGERKQFLDRQIDVELANL